ncbi:hypothetical protein K6U06_12300 [Acidiferrimicrobium sp. IK]|nr:hypothetical protein [Acidiferrimicrobium sp. IK]
MGTIRRKCLDRMLLFGRRHLEAVLANYVKHYDPHRPHRPHRPSGNDRPHTPMRPLPHHRRR